MKRIPKYIALKGMGVAFLLFTLGSTISHGIFPTKVAWFFTYILRLFQVFWVWILDVLKFVYKIT